MKAVKRLQVLILTLFMLISSSVVAFASSTAAEAYNELVRVVHSGDYRSAANTSAYVDVTEKSYKTSGGGFLLYSELIPDAGSSDHFVNETKFQTLTSAAKQDFLQDQLKIANLMAADTEAGHGTITKGVSNDTVVIMTNVLQQKSGMGSQLLASLLQNTKPDYVTANRIYQPFSGVVGTFLGFASIIIVALLGCHMGLDLAFINLPTIQLIFGDGEGKDGEKIYSKLISRAARRAVKQAEGEGNGSGGGKSATWAYFWMQVKEITILVIALLYLIAGQIFSLVARFVDLFSGFLS